MPASLFAAEGRGDTTLQPRYFRATHQCGAPTPRSMRGARPSHQPSSAYPIRPLWHFANRPAAIRHSLRTYDHAIVVADFTAGSDEFNRRLIELGSTLGTTISLLQRDPAAADGTLDPSAEILLEGLRHRLGMTPESCRIVKPQALSRLLSRKSLNGIESRVVIVGRAASHRLDENAGAGLLFHHTQAVNCDVIAVEETPDWD